MSVGNLAVLIALLLGLALFLAGLLRDKSSNFDDGSFIVQIILMVAGGALVALALLAKFIASLFG